MNKHILLSFIAFILIVTGGFWMISPWGEPTAGEAIAAETKAADTAEKPVDPWGVRCDGEKKDQCEIVQRLIEQETGKRFAEFAIGYPEDAEGARGVVILPLGVLLESGVKMQIDDGKAYQFNFRYCGAGGCVAVIKVSDSLIAEMKKGNSATIQFVSAKGQKINLPITLKGFTKAIAQVQK